MVKSRLAAVKGAVDFFFKTGVHFYKSMLTGPFFYIAFVISLSVAIMSGKRGGKGLSDKDLINEVLKSPKVTNVPTI